MTLPLHGITVVALEHAVAAPFASRQLADLGARVIKIERPESGDFARGYDKTVHGESSFFVWINRGKESVALDLKQPSDQAVLQALVAKADVLIQNLAPGASSRMGLNFETLHATHKKLIVCDISGYGEGGPLSDKKAYDLLIQAASGLISLTGTPEMPVRTGISIADIAAGMYAYSGILAALLRRATTGEGSRVEVAMLEAMTEWVSFGLNFAHYGGTAPVRMGTTHPAIAPYGKYQTGDGKHIIFGMQNDREWAVFCEKVLRLPQTTHDPRFATNVLRVENRVALDEVIHGVLAQMTQDDMQARLDAADIANAPLNGMAEVWAHPQFAARGRWRTVGTPGGDIQALLPPATLSGMEAVMGDVPALGQHTQAIRREFS